MGWRRMDRLRITAEEYNLTDNYRSLKNQFITGINDEFMTTEIIKELTTIKDTG